MFRSTVLLPYSFRHNNIRLAEAIGVGDQAGDDKAALLIKLVGVAAQVADRLHVVADIWIEVNAADRG